MPLAHAASHSLKRSPPRINLLHRAPTLHPLSARYRERIVILGNFLDEEAANNLIAVLLYMKQVCSITRSRRPLRRNFVAALEVTRM